MIRAFLGVHLFLRLVAGHGKDAQMKFVKTHESKSEASEDTAGEDKTKGYAKFPPKGEGAYGAYGSVFTVTLRCRRWGWGLIKWGGGCKGCRGEGREKKETSVTGAFEERTHLEEKGVLATVVYHKMLASDERLPVATYLTAKRIQATLTVT
jgi:hypothetical protein